MGRGIVAAIPIAYNPKNFSEKFLEGYIFDKEKKSYFLKEELLVDNYQSFLEEFYELIGEPKTLEGIPVAANFSDFEAVFDKDKRDMYAPFLYNSSVMFSFLGGKSSYYWLFYNGSYKAYLEVYSTFLHFERILNKAMKNPLTSFIKFGIFG
jgi:hypothetical protein